MITNCSPIRSPKTINLVVYFLNFCYTYFNLKIYVAVAQLDRVPGYEPGGCRFKPCQLHQNALIYKCIFLTC